MDPPPSFGSFPELEEEAKDTKHHKPSHGKKWRRTHAHIRTPSDSPRHQTHRDPPSTSQSDHPPAASSDYIIDKLGDTGNVRFERNDNSKVSKFKRIGGSKVLGLNPGLRILNSLSKDKVEIGPVYQKKDLRYTHPSYHRRNTSSRLKRITGKHSSALELEQQSSFISLPNQQSLVERMENVEHEGDQMYRSIVGDLQAGDLSSDFESTDDEKAENYSVDDDPAQQEFLKRNAEIEGLLRNNPNAIDAWLQLVKHQEDFYNDIYQSDTGTKARQEIKVSILERALNVRGNETDERLLLKYLEAIGELWDAKSLHAKWKEILTRFPTATSLWMAYVSFRQTAWATFKIDTVVQVYQESLDMLRSKTLEAKQGSTDVESIEENMVYLFFRLCLMLSEAGYHERAVASFQSQLELNFFSPDRYRPLLSEENWNNALLGLEEFWESEAPRIGETDAAGWKNSMDSSAQSMSKKLQHDESTEYLKDSFNRWASLEREYLFQKHMPSKMSTEEDDDDDADVHKIVLFSDIQPFLFPITSEGARLSLIYSFLVFLGVPISPPDVPTSSAYFADSFINTQLCHNRSARDAFWPKVPSKAPIFDVVGGHPMDPTRITGLENPFSAPFNSIPSDPETLFESNNTVAWFSVLNRLTLSAAQVDIAANSLLLLLKVVNSTFLTLVLFSIDVHSQQQRGFPKKILANERRTLLLWDGYARSEIVRRRLKSARDVYSSSLSIASSFDAEDREDEMVLWRGWVDLEWSLGNEIVMMNVILAYTGVLPADVELASLKSLQGSTDYRTSQRIMRAQKFLDNQLNSAFLPDAPSWKIRHRESFAYLKALFTYVRHQRDVKTAGEVFEGHLGRLENLSSRSPTEEEAILLLHCKLLYRHMKTKTGYRPHELRNLLEIATGKYPRNTAFLLLYVFNELRTKLQNRARKLLKTKVLQPEIATSTSWAVAIYVELHMDIKRINVAAVQSLFERAVNDALGRSSWMIWSLYIEFEIKQENHKKAKNLFYQAIRQCPWAKDLYLVPFIDLRSAFSSKELENVQNLMLEKGLRIVNDAGLESGAVGDEERDDVKDGNVSDGSSDKERRERDRMMPY